MSTKQEILGQYFTKREIVDKLLELLISYKEYNKDIKILEPSAGTRNFVFGLKSKNFNNIQECEIDKDLTEKPEDFFNLSLNNKYDLIIGNPPFSKFNVKDSYYEVNNYLKSPINPISYVNRETIKKGRDRIENIFILKSLKHLNNDNSSLAYVLPISFFIKNKNKIIKEAIIDKFSTIIIYQNDKIWFDRSIPCCFLIATNIKELDKKIISIYENGKRNEEVFDIKNINEELIPLITYHKNNGHINNEKGVPLAEFLAENSVKIKKSFTDNNVSAKNILEKSSIPTNSNVDNFKMAVVRVGNSSVGKCGLIDKENDVINDMFYIFDFKKEYSNDQKIKEAICEQINKNIDYFRKITCRVGSKSIKKEDVLKFRVAI